MSMRDAPAEIMRALITAELAASSFYNVETGVVTPNHIPFGYVPPTVPLYVSSLPDGPGVPHDAGTVFDTSGINHWRLLASGKNIVDFGIQVMNRALNYRDAYSRLDAMQEYLSTVKMVPVTLGSDNYVVNTVRLTSPVVSAGKDDQERARCTVNFLVSIKAL